MYEDPWAQGKRRGAIKKFQTTVPVDISRDGCFVNDYNGSSPRIFAIKTVCWFVPVVDARSLRTARRVRRGHREFGNEIDGEKVLEARIAAGKDGIPFGSLWHPLVPFGTLWFPLVSFKKLSRNVTLSEDGS